MLFFHEYFIYACMNKKEKLQKFQKLKKELKIKQIR